MSSVQDRKKDWTSLEIVKRLAPIAASLIFVLVGFWISKEVENFKSAAERSSKQMDGLVQKRLAIYDEIGRKRNQMSSYYMYIGKWKELSPEDIVRDKRDLDEIIFTYQPFFSQVFIATYSNLEHQMFLNRSVTGEKMRGFAVKRPIDKNSIFLPKKKRSPAILVGLIDSRPRSARHQSGSLEPFS